MIPLCTPSVIVVFIVKGHILLNVGSWKVTVFLSVRSTASQGHTMHMRSHCISNCYSIAWNAQLSCF